MDPFYAKVVAAATGSTMTALTSAYIHKLISHSAHQFQVTPFDVIKTRLQTQPLKTEPLFPRPPLNTCCHPTGNLASCVRNMSSLTRPLAGEVVCVWHDGILRTERVNGFLDAVRHVWRAEGMRGLWKGAGTSLSVSSLCLWRLSADLTSE
jgi:solute carrier family 25 protein 39/40